MTSPTILTQPLVRRSLDGPPRVGAAARKRYVWKGKASDPVFVFQNCRDVEYERIDVVIESPCEAVVVCERTSSQPGTIPSTNNTFHKWRIYGNGLAERGIWMRATIDENQEHAEITSNTFYGITRPIVFEGVQSKHHVIRDNVFEGFDVAVTSDTGFEWSGKTAAKGKILCELTRIGDPVAIRSVGVEACGRLLVTAGPATDAQEITLDTLRFAADQLHEDGACVVLRHAGALVIIGGAYGDGHQRVPVIELAGIGEQSLTFVAPKFGAFGAHQVLPYRWRPGVRPNVSFVGTPVYQTGATDSDRTTVHNAHELDRL